MVITIKNRVDAYKALQDCEFQQKWQALYNQCPWATPFQDYRFVSTWYEVYRERYEPVLLCGADADGNLTGLLALASRTDSEELVVAGAYQAEYQVWLATPEAQIQFIEKALAKLQEAFPGQSLTFRYLPPMAPTEWTEKRYSGGPYFRIEGHWRPMLVLHDTEKLAESFRKKSNKSRLNRLRRIGKVEFEEIKTSYDLSLILDQITSHYDLRQGAINDTVPFREDPLKTSFYLTLMDTQMLHVTVLKVGKEVAAAHLGVQDKHHVHLGVFTHSPFLAEHSPGKIHLLMLAGKLADQHFLAFDLTPGSDPWKERFATAHEQVHIVTVYFGYNVFFKHRLARYAKALAKYGLRCFGLTSKDLRLLYRKLQSGQLIDASRVVRKVRKSQEFRFYVCQRKDVERLGRPASIMNRNHVGDLLAFQSCDGQTRQDFLASCLSCLEEGCHPYTLVEKGLLMYCAWLAPRPIQSLFSEVSSRFSLPEQSAGLFGFYTSPKAMGAESYISSLRQMLFDAAAIPETEQIFVILPARDYQARRAIEKIMDDNLESLFRELEIR